MFYLIIGWIIVVGFAATLVITLLSLVGKITIEEQYKKSSFQEPDSGNGCCRLFYFLPG